MCEGRSICGGGGGGKNIQGLKALEDLEEYGKE